MTTEQLRLTLAACAVTVSLTFCGLGTIKIKNDTSIAKSTERIAEAAERAHPAPLYLRPVEEVRIKKSVKRCDHSVAMPCEFQE